MDSKNLISELALKKVLESILCLISVDKREIPDWNKKIEELLKDVGKIKL